MLQISNSSFFTFLFCCYALLIPFEHILEIIWGIDTFLKPYRIFALLIIGSYVVRIITTKKWLISQDIKHDILLYLLLSYGVIISAIQVFISPFKISNFYNDSFQISLYLGCFFVLKNIPLSYPQIKKIIWALVIGITLNASYIAFIYLYLNGWMRQEGFMDNPNYVSISLVLATVFIFIQSNFSTNFFTKISFFLLTFFLSLMVVAAGSRTGFAIFTFNLLLLFWFASIGRKLILLSAFGFLFLLYLSNSSSTSAGINIPLITFKRLDKIDSTEDTRFPLWRGAYKAVLTSNFAGLGIGQFKTRFREFYLTETEETIYENVNRGAQLSSHSDFVGITVVYGLFGILCYLYFLYLSFKSTLRKIWLAPTEISYHHYQFCLLVLVTLTIFGITSENFTSALFWISLAIATKYIPFNSTT